MKGWKTKVITNPFNRTSLELKPVFDGSREFVAGTF